MKIGNNQPIFTLQEVNKNDPSQFIYKHMKLKR